MTVDGGAPAMSGDYVRRAAAEFVGTFALVFVGAGALIYGDIVGIALASGFVIAVMACALIHVSGGHFNPAITFGVVLARRMSVPLAVAYWIVQLGAAALAALLLKWLMPEGSLPNLGAPAVNTSIGTGEAVVIEAVLTFFLVWTVFATVVDPRGAFRQISGLAVGLAVAFGTLMGAGLTGAAMNPARAFGPELASNTWADWWVWVLGPLAGATVAAVVYEALYLRPWRPDAPAPEPEPEPEPVPGPTLSGPPATTDAPG
jgi:aquaporin Z